jgi:hypothetical protein
MGQPQLHVVQDPFTARKVTEQYTASIERVLEGDIREVDFLVDGCIPRGNITLVTGESGCGKTFIVYDLALAVASCGSWLGRGKPLPNPETVLILNYDNPTNEVKRRITQLGFTKNMPVHFHTEGFTSPPKTSPPMLKLPDENARLKIIIETLAPSLIIVDTLRQAHALDENDNQDCSLLMALFKEWTALPSNPAVVILHHTSKSKESGWNTNSRGSGEIPGSSDVCLEIEMDGEENKTLKWTKHRPWEIGSTKSCKFEIIDELIDEQEDEFSLSVNATSTLPGEVERINVERMMKSLGNRTLGVKELAKFANLKEKTTRDCIMRARRKGLIEFSREKKSTGWRASQL